MFLTYTRVTGSALNIRFPQHKSNFKQIGSAADKIEQGEFAIQDSATRRDVDLSSAWETCFSPGQHVDMSMIFTMTKTLLTHCPKCNDNCNEMPDKDVEWYALNPNRMYS